MGLLMRDVEVSPEKELKKVTEQARRVSYAHGRSCAGNSCSRPVTGNLLTRGDVDTLDRRAPQAGFERTLSSGHPRVQ
jgi:hypothetical protein